jgi:hypothetical protein
MNFCVTCHLHHNPPHILCPAEHHLHHKELASLHIDSYTLGTHYCRKTKCEDGVCMFIHTSITFTTFIVDNYCLVYYRLCMLAIYISPLGNLSTFQNNFGMILHKFFNPKFNFIICCDIIIINYLMHSYKKINLTICYTLLILVTSSIFVRR